VRYWSDVLTSLQLAIEAARAIGAQKIEFWSTGDVDERSLATASQMGVVVHQNILENPIFQRPRDADPTVGRETLAGAGSARPPTPPMPAQKQGEGISATQAESLPKPPAVVAAKRKQPSASPPSSPLAPALPSAPHPSPSAPTPVSVDEERDMPAFKF